MFFAEVTVTLDTVVYLVFLDFLNIWTIEYSTDIVNLWVEIWRISTMCASMVYCDKMSQTEDMELTFGRAVMEPTKNL